MKFRKIREPIKKVGPNQFVLGDNPLEPNLYIDSNKIAIPENLEIQGIDFRDYITGAALLSGIFNNQTIGRYSIDEAFELNSNGDLMPTNADNVSDTMWILKNENDLQLRGNHWRYNTGPDAFTEDISF
jgi:hypothetical protein